MSQGVVLTAGQPENNSAVVGTVAEATNVRGKCIRPSAPRAAKTAKYRSSPATGDLCIALTATPLQGDRQLSSEPERWQSTAVRNHDEDDRQVGMVPDSSLLPIMQCASQHFLRLYHFYALSPKVILSLFDR